MSHMTDRRISFEARTERVLRLDQNLPRELGPHVLEGLHDPSAVEIMLNADGRLWIEHLEFGGTR